MMYPPSMYERLRAVDSSKVRKGAVAVYQPGTRMSQNGYEGFGRGQLFNQMSKQLHHQDWVVLLSKGLILPVTFRQQLSQLVLNPGVWYRIGGAVLLNQRAGSLLQIGLDGIAQTKCLEELERRWDKDKVVQLIGLVADDHGEEKQWRQTVEDNFLQDQKFRECFETVLLQAIPAKGPVIITQSASYSLTRGLLRLLREIGFEPHVLTHERFASFFFRLFAV